VNPMQSPTRHTPVQGNVVIRLGGSVASLFGLGFTYGFFTHERPPTTGHIVAGLAVGIPAVITIIAIAALGIRAVVTVQGVEMVALFVALTEQQLPKNISYMFGVLLLCLLPMAITSTGIHYNKRNGGNVPFFNAIFNQHNIFIGIIFAWGIVKILRGITHR
jgi:hypothetical protein